ncbi:DUF169 domain-containing protein [Moorella sulfitireducens]|uniref:DUF169 domain-containing protein n=1 Tax=Neomoorella sulfitireducens TaxID=2972948 RepID=UPI0021ACDC40
MDNQQLASIYKDILALRWEPVAVRLLRPGEAVPAGVAEPTARLRHCQSIIAARRGYSLYMPTRRHACPDGAAIMGLIPMPPKLQSGELYLLFKKLPTLECARKMIAARPYFPAGSYEATLVAPLSKASFEADVVIFTLWPEQAMWLCMAQSYNSGERHSFNTSGYNSTCADLTVQPMQTGKMNISFGCYGGRASSDIDDFELYLSLPAAQLEMVARSLQKLAQKSIPEARHKIYMPPVLDKVGAPEKKRGDVPAVQISIDAAKCLGEGLCADFCPYGVLVMEEHDGRQVPVVKNPEQCTACYTCVGQCPAGVIQVLQQGQ